MLGRKAFLELPWPLVILMTRQGPCSSWAQILLQKLGEQGSPWAAPALPSEGSIHLFFLMCGLEYLVEPYLKSVWKPLKSPSQILQPIQSKENASNY